ncbi:VOC family protein [Streptomyces sp. NPDC059695]|uniref:VOC family protein n=1 Tax=Streptomyces sp. NPDC059695 TaxID=3346910 RepID=UPI0036BD03C5
MSTSSREIAGAPCWVSLMARDTAASQRFYSDLLDWEFRPSRLGVGFSVAFHEGAPVAGIGALTEDIDVPVAWTPYFAVDDADVTAARIVERGATMAVGPLAFGIGRAGLAADPAGAVFGFWQGSVIPDWSVGRGSAPAWLELRTRDVLAASTFYGQVFDWAGDRPGACVASFEHDRVVLRHGSATVARVSGEALEGASDDAARPRWQVHFPVPDLDEAIGIANRTGGGTASPVHVSRTSRWVDLVDAEGARFAVVTPQDRSA